MSKKNILVSISETAQFFGVSIDTIRRWDKEGILHSVRPTGKTRFFYRKDLEVLKSYKEPFALKRNKGKTVKKERFAESSQIPEKIYIDQNLKPLQRIPELLVTTVAFFLLLTLGIRNVINSQIKPPKRSKTPAVLSKTTKIEEIKPTPAEEIKPKITVMIEADPESIINIREEPATSSAKIGKAKGGDTFEFISLDAGWYQVKLADGSIGFISAEYITSNDQ